MPDTERPTPGERIALNVSIPAKPGLAEAIDNAIRAAEAPLRERIAEAEAALAAEKAARERAEAERDRQLGCRKIAQNDRNAYEVQNDALREALAKEKAARERLLEQLGAKVNEVGREWARAEAAEAAREKAEARVAELEQGTKAARVCYPNPLAEPLAKEKARAAAAERALGEARAEGIEFARRAVAAHTLWSVAEFDDAISDAKAALAGQANAGEGE